MSDSFHIAVVGPRPTKTNNRNNPFPNANADFVMATLNRVKSDEVAAIYHGATEYGVDSIAEHHATEASLRQRQFPAYWFDPTKSGNVNKAAGIQSREAMIRKISDSIHNKENTYGVLLVFHTTENPTEDAGLKSLLEFIAKYHSHIQVRCFRLPVTDEVKEEQQMIDLSASSGIPDPFALPQ